MDLTSKKHEDLANMQKVREIRFEYAEKAIKELKLEKNPKFKIAVESSKSLISSINSLERYPDDFMYESVTRMHKLNSYTSQLLMNINILYGIVYTKSTSKIEDLKDQYIAREVDAKGGEIYRKQDYYSAYKEALLETDLEKRQKSMHYLRHDLSVLENANSELEKNHNEYLSALDEGTTERQVQTMQAIFLMEELSNFGNIKFEKLEEWVESNRRHVESISHEDIDNVLYNLYDLKALRGYILSLSPDQQTDDDMQVELKLHRKEFND
jgi:hypothetical protein